ncbi:MAG TPA: hypothetical protein VMD55_08255 [Terracidiphilus sp.]|jgi:hypothetical protein|nr:hypothetical protein [Terracidiphilus sp.]
MHALALLLQNPDQLDPEMIRRIVGACLVIIPIIIVVSIAVVMIPCWFVLKKAGFTPWLSLLCIMPTLGTLILLYVLAFAQWKVAPAPVQAYWPPQPPAPPQPPQG